MSDLSHRKSLYSSPSSRSFINRPPPESALRDTSINIATAFSTAERPSPYRSNNNVYLSPRTKRTSLHHRSSTDHFQTLVGSDNDFFGSNKPIDLYQHSVSQSSSSDEEDDNPFEEEERLVRHPAEEEHRRELIQQRSSLSERYDATNGSLAGSSFHSFMESPYKNQHDTILDDDNINSNDTPTTTAAAQIKPASRSLIKHVFDRTFEIVMFWIFMVFWVIKEIAVTVITFIFIVASSLMVNPIVYMLQYLGFRTLEPLKLSSFKSISHHPVAMTLLAIFSTFCLHWIFFDQHNDNNNNHPTWFNNNNNNKLWPFSTTLSAIISSPSSWRSFNPTTSSMDDTRYDSLALDRFKVLEKTVHGIIDHIETQDKHDQQQINSIHWHLEQLQQQFSQWSTTHSKQIESALIEQMEKVEHTLATTTTQWNRRLHEWGAQLEQKMEQQEHIWQQDGNTNPTVSPQLVNALRQLFIPKSDDDRALWTSFLQNNQGILDRHIQDMMDQWLRDQLLKGTLIDKDTLNETLMTQILQQDTTDDKMEKTAGTINLLGQLVDAAIQRYHQDVLDKPDYALATRGAMVLNAFTSPTLPSSSSAGTNNQWWWTKWYTEWSRPSLSPMIALTPGTHVGQCWPMKGNHGSLGIRLSEPISVQSITVEYPSRSVASNNMTSAPKQIDVWGLKKVDGSSSNVMAQWDQQQQEQHITGNNNENDNMIFLGSFTYDIKKSSASSSIQTFSLDTNRYVHFEGVVLRIRSNWGNDQHTCIYRVRVHGTPAI
ncbi:uncharacterized protein BX664DRAFT_387613 [Halteromyces radiatus]|uniref:uncharacterized protein n=1 Tax=Halteromyces radiatus TaxID=101107 RepID=UPI00221E9BA2|nr:uncharacterized protein BX664DRAFT_387613 [Halteromyces radiatus]KAI8084954.1 hypothetical protein BX664DRAFT_387613 [Halteromyces radiatus]